MKGRRDFLHNMRGYAMYTTDKYNEIMCEAVACHSYSDTRKMSEKELRDLETPDERRCCFCGKILIPGDS